MKTKMKKLGRDIRKNAGLYILLAIPMTVYLVQYMPMYGLQIAFRKFNPTLGITGTPGQGSLILNNFLILIILRT